MKSNGCEIRMSICCEYTSNLALKIRNHTQSLIQGPINLLEFGIDWDFYVTRWGSEYSSEDKSVRFTADLVTNSFLE